MPSLPSPNGTEHAMRQARSDTSKAVTCDAPLSPALDAKAAQQLDLPAVNYDEAGFRFALNEDAMATEKLAEGIRGFAVDAGKLDKLIEDLRQAA